MNWKYKGKEITSVRQLPENVKGFIYLLTFSDGKQYIGRKGFFSTRKKKFGKKQLAAITDKRLKTYETVVTESDWINYNSSNKTIREGIKTGDVQIESREILKLCFTDKQMT